MHQLTVRMSAPTSTEALNIFAFTEANTAQVCATALEDFYTEMLPFIHSDATIDIDPTSRDLDETTGGLTGLHPVSWSAPLAGTGVGTRPPDATALLLRWGTNTILGGRLIKGRTYLPYPPGTMGGGQITPAVLTTVNSTLQTAMANLTAVEFSIWHRPGIAGNDGNLATVVSGSVPAEYSVQRGRRD